MIKSFYYFIKLIFLQKHLIISMAKREVATQYVGSLLGFIWTFINPMVMIFVFWVVFSVGFRVQSKNDVNFFVAFCLFVQTIVIKKNQMKKTVDFFTFFDVKSY